MGSGATTMTRRGWLARLLVAAAMAPVAGLRRADPVNAEKKQFPSVAERTASQRQLCETLGGGRLAVLDGPDGCGCNTTECKGGTEDGHTCFNTPTKTTCTQQQTTSPQPPITTPGELPDQPLEPLDPGDPPVTDPEPVTDRPLEPAVGNVTLDAGHGPRRRKRARRGKRKRHGRRR